jgi:hypothetical protein
MVRQRKGAGVDVASTAYWDEKTDGESGGSSWEETQSLL